MAQVYFVPAASATPVDRDALRDAWIALLGRWEWEWFCTFTFRDMVHPEAADKRFRVLISQANRVLAYREQRSNTGRYPVQCAGQRSSTRVGRGWRVLVGGHHGPVCMDSGRRVQRITHFRCNFAAQ